jgi:hypothetical protein
VETLPDFVGSHARILPCYNVRACSIPRSWCSIACFRPCA